VKQYIVNIKYFVKACFQLILGEWSN